MGNLGDYARCDHEGRHRIKQQVDILHLIGKLLDGKGRDPHLVRPGKKVTLPDPYADLSAQSVERAGQGHAHSPQSQHDAGGTVDGDVRVLDGHHQSAFHRRNRIVDGHIIALKQLDMFPIRVGGAFRQLIVRNS